MMLLVVLVSVIVASNAAQKELMENIKAAGAKCIEEEKPNDDDINRLLASQMPDSHEGKCVIFCVYKSFNTMNEDGTVNVEGGIAALEPVKEDDAGTYEKIVGVFKNCATTITLEGDPCNTAANLIKCVFVDANAAGIPMNMFSF